MNSETCLSIDGLLSEIGKIPDDALNYDVCMSDYFENGGIASDVCLTNAIDNFETTARTVLHNRNGSCPHCGADYYMENSCESTAMYFPPIYKNGVNINPDRNIITKHCTCMECGKNFTIKNR